ncbi:ead/Ea22-like family protein [Pseudomonas aeruginosa]|uniref:ead/Ea22-like family protein n=1 Tax=Pseudomonas aeruginosa TaxID=287 RepID=UPI000DEBA3B2|nr:ead/Ea22-like family protein [Pseudomonas aeruginosa]RCH40769.1 ead/Ea22-like family protein [Pseudomonas aeruginosa]HEJ5892288.1 hypothetical protein [Pseudomonas aeruginosa]
MTDTNKLKELAERATPGPWVVDAQQSGAIFNIESESGDQCVAMSQENPAPTRLEMNEQRRVNAAFIAAANPKAILGLIAEVERLKAELSQCASALPGTYYMDPPDGGNVSIPEQIRRMAKDAARYRALRQKERGVVVVRNRTSHLFGEHLDAAIDAAIEGAKQ